MTLTAKEKSFIGQTVTLRCVEILDHKAAISKDFDVGQDYLAVVTEGVRGKISFRLRGKSKTRAWLWAFGGMMARKVRFKVRVNLVDKESEQ